MCCQWELGHFFDICRVFIVMSRMFVSMGRQVGGWRLQVAGPVPGAEGI